MVQRGFVIFQNVPIFWSNYNLDLSSYGQLFVLGYGYSVRENIAATVVKMRGSSQSLICQNVD